MKRTDMLEEEKKEQSRVVEVQKITPEALLAIFDKLEVTPIGDISVPSEGRIATNIIQNTDRGNLMIRIYPKDMPNKLETGNPYFEIQALDFLAKKGLKVPIPTPFKGSTIYTETEESFIFAYFMLEGNAIKQSELNPDIAAKIGVFLKEFVDVSITYAPSLGEKPINSFEYILGIAERLEQKVEGLAEWGKWREMKLKVATNIESVESTPAGIVHADFFFENILRTTSNGEISALIDFGDAYYGRVIHDIVIAAMESSVNEDGIWNLDSFRATLVPLVDFFRSNGITFDQVYHTLEADCLRFAVYTIPFNIEEGTDYRENSYVARFEHISDSVVIGELHEIYDSLF